MAVSGSTRMQTTTVELLAAGAALEIAANRWLKENLTEEELSVIGGEMLELEQYADAFVSLLSSYFLKLSPAKCIVRQRWVKRSIVRSP